MDKEKSCLECYWCNTAGCVHREYTGEICVDKRYWKMKEKRTCESHECETCEKSKHFKKGEKQIIGETGFVFECDVTRCVPHGRAYSYNCDLWQSKSQSLDKTGQGESDKEYVVLLTDCIDNGCGEHIKRLTDIVRAEAISAHKKSLVEKIEKAICDCEDGNCKDCAVKEIINLIEEVEK